MRINAAKYTVPIWITSIVILILIAVLILIQYFWISAMIDMRKSMMTKSIYLAFNESAYDIIGLYDEKPDDQDRELPCAKCIVPPEEMINYKSMINNTIKYYMDNYDIDVSYYWAVVDRDGSDVLIENDMFFLNNQAISTQTYRISSMYQQFPYDLVIRFFSNRWQIPKVVYSTIFALGFCFFVLITGILYNTRLYYKRQKDTDFWIDFIGNMIHEFKTPISTISLASEMMMNSKTHQNLERIVHYSSVIYKENHHLKEMIDKLLRTVSLDVGAMALNFVPTDIHEEIQKVTDSFYLRIEEKGGTLKTELKANNSIILGDKMHISNVIANLLENAEKYSDDAPQIHIETKSDRNGLYLSVKDNGIGIPSKHVGRLFDKFYRVRSNRSYSDSGYGLGLFYVNYIVQAHHGAIRVTSKEKNGSTFELFFPYHS